MNHRLKRAGRFYVLSWTITVIAIFCHPWSSSEAGPATQMEAMGSYSGFFISYETAQRVGNLSPAASSDTPQQTTCTITTTIMFPGKKFGYGMELPWLTRNWSSVDESGELNGGGDRSTHGLSNLSLVAKYQFGVTHQVSFGGINHRLSAAITLMMKLILPSGYHREQRANGQGIPSWQTPGSGVTSLGTGFYFHTDTARWFRILGHLMFVHPVAYEAVKPGDSLHTTVGVLLAKLPFFSRYYPSLALKYSYSSKSFVHGAQMPHSQGSVVFFTPGIRSLWWYNDALQTFIMVETGVSLLVYRSSDYRESVFSGVFFGFRAYFR